LVTADAMASGGVLPQPIPVDGSHEVVAGLKTAFPDTFDIQQVTVNGNEATVKVVWSGTNTGALRPAHARDGEYPGHGKKYP